MHAVCHVAVCCSLDVCNTSWSCHVGWVCAGAVLRTPVHSRTCSDRILAATSSDPEVMHPAVFQVLCQEHHAGHRLFRLVRHNA
jgi:hypothetical protein